MDMDSARAKESGREGLKLDKNRVKELGIHIRDVPEIGAERRHGFWRFEASFNI